jgi:hypothetical protein
MMEDRPRLTPEETQLILDRFRERVPQLGICPICHSPKWTLNPHGIVFLPMQTDLDNVSLSGPGLPLAVISCTNCGNTHLINVLILGLPGFLHSKASEARSG